jgi:hypothetical protein
MVETLRAIGTAAIVATMALAWVVVIVHHFLASWWKTPEGRHVFTFELVLAVVLGLWGLRLIIPEGDWFLFIRVVAFALLPVVLVWRLRILIANHRRARKARLEAENGQPS